MDLEDKMSPINLKGTEKRLKISGFGIIKYYVRSESEGIIALQVMVYHGTGLQNDLRIIYPQVIGTS